MKHNLRVISGNRKTRKHESSRLRLAVSGAPRHAAHKARKTRASRKSSALYEKDTARKKLEARGKPYKNTPIDRGRVRDSSRQKTSITALTLENNALRRHNRQLRATVQALRQQLKGTNVNRLLPAHQALQAANERLRAEIERLRALSVHDSSSMHPGRVPGAIARNDAATEQPDDEYGLYPNAAIPPETEDGTSERDEQAQQDPPAAADGRYDALFAHNVETPDVTPDPAVWDVISAAVPEHYSIPDPAFTEVMARSLEELFEHSNAS